MNRRFFNIIFLIAYSACIALCVIYYNLGYLTSLGLFFFIPSLYFSLLKKDAIKKTLVYSIISALPVVFIFDYIAHVSKAWYVPSEIGIVIFNAFPVDQIFWAFLYFYFIIIMRHYFWPNDNSTKIFVHNIKKLFILILCFGIPFTTIFLIDRNLLVIDYFYILFAPMIMLIPGLIILYYHPQHIKKVILLTSIIILPFLCYEYSALRTEQWFFPGNHYIGWIHLFDVKFPVEELMFLLFSVSGTISLYETLSQPKKHQ